MIYAIYARKSNEQKGVEDAEKSVTKQIERARAYAAQKDWTVAEEHVYVDDGISGAEFRRRPGFIRLMRAVEQRTPPFDVLIMDEEKSLGRNSVETSHLLKRIIDHGVRVFNVLDDREVDMSDAISTGMAQLRGIGAEVEREQTSKRVYAAATRKALAGHVTGGRVYGYRNVDHFSGALDKHGRPVRSYVTLEPIPEEAAVLRRIFELYASGTGFIGIAKVLTAEGVIGPRGNGWSPGTVGEILHRTTYAGTIQWNRTKKVARLGTISRKKRPPEEHKAVEVPGIRIIEGPLWRAVQDRLAQAAAVLVRRSGGRLIGRAYRLDAESPYLMTGFLTCASCKGPLGGVAQLHGQGPAADRDRVMVYACCHHRKRGSCDNRTAIRTGVVDDAVLTAIARAIDGEMLCEAVDRALATLTAGRDEWQVRRRAVEKELAEVEAGLARIVGALASGERFETLVDALKAGEERKRALLARLAQTPAAPPSLDAARIKRDLRALAADVTGLLLGHRTPQIRAMLRKVLPGPVTAEPVVVDGRRGYRLTGEACWGALLDDEVANALQPHRDPADYAALCTADIAHGASRDRSLS